MFRELKADEIEVRVGSVGKKGDGVSLLLYKDARCDMNLLDEAVGADRWQRKHEVIDGILYCSVGIKFDEWVWKQDCGTESIAEKDKGKASDSFKRACFNWGIGRELYTAPFMWVTDCEIVNNKCYDKFFVKDITYEKRIIKDLVIVNKKGNVVFTTGRKPKADNKPKAVKCPKCDRVIAEGTNKAGNLVTPEEILKKLGMCAICYKEKK